MLLRSIASRTRAVSAVSSLSLARKKSAKNGSYATTCTPGTTITVSFAADLQSSSQAARADVGIWIANDEQSTAMDSGSCSHFYFTPGNDPSSGELPDFEGATADSCGGLGAQQLFTEVALKSPETTLQIPCVDTDNDGGVDIDYCASWKVPGQETACPYNGSYRKGTVPGTKSKCKCGRVDTNICLDSSKCDGGELLRIGDPGPTPTPPSLTPPTPTPPSPTPPPTPTPPSPTPDAEDVLCE